MIRGFVGAALAVLLFSAGVAVGRTTVKPPVVFQSQQKAAVVQCFEWVSANFKEPTLGMYEMACHGGSR